MQDEMKKIGALNFQGNLPPQSYSRSSQYLFSCQLNGEGGSPKGSGKRA
ncbi:unnamed protein product [Musa acuminata var. zebrina]